MCISLCMYESYYLEACINKVNGISRLLRVNGSSLLSSHFYVTGREIKILEMIKWDVTKNVDIHCIKANTKPATRSQKT